MVTLRGSGLGQGSCVTITGPPGCSPPSHFPSCSPELQCGQWPAGGSGRTAQVGLIWDEGRVGPCLPVIGWLLTLCLYY